MKKQLRFFIFALLISTSVFAGGFQVNLQGQKQTGMGHTGTGLLTDNASIFFNPGAMSFLDSLRSITVGGSFIFPRITFLDPNSGYVTHIEHHTGTPITLYTVLKFKKTDKWNFGLGIYNPFGSKVQYPDDWKGQFLLREIDLKTFFVQPTLSLKLNDKVGVGFGFIYAFGDFSLRQAVPIQFADGKYGEGNLFGKASGTGFNAGVYYKINEKLSFGLDYRSQVNVSVKSGSAEFKVPASVAEFFPTTTFSTKLRLPSTLTFGAGYAVNKNLKLALDINYVGWKSYDTLTIDFADNTNQLQDIHSPRCYHNAFIFRLGGQYKLGERWHARLGGYYDMSPADAGYLTPETPDENKIGITAGASFLITPKFHIDASLLYIEGLKRTDTNIEKNFTGTYKEKAVVPGISLSYIF